MLKQFLLALIFGLLGAILLPIIAFFGALAAFYGFEPKCGAAGDSGGCEMSAAVIGFAAALPGLLIGIVFGIWLARRGRQPRVTSGIADPTTPQTIGNLSGAELDGIRAWAAGVPEIHRVWLIGERARARPHPDSPIELAVELFMWDSPDPRDRSQMYGTWYYGRKGWAETLAGLSHRRFKLRHLSIDGEDGALRAVPADCVSLYER